MHRAMRETVDEVGRVAAAEPSTATGRRAAPCSSPAPPPQLERAPARSPRPGSYGFGEDDLRLLTADEAR